MRHQFFKDMTVFERTATDLTVMGALRGAPVVGRALAAVVSQQSSSSQSSSKGDDAGWAESKEGVR